MKMLAEHLFSSLFQHACLVTCFHFCTVHTDDRQSFTLHSLLVELAQDRVKKERVSVVIRMFHSLIVSCVFWDARTLH